MTSSEPRGRRVPELSCMPLGLLQSCLRRWSHSERIVQHLLAARQSELGALCPDAGQTSSSACCASPRTTRDGRGLRPRVAVTAASRLPPLRLFGARGVGIEIDPRRIEESSANAKAAGVEQLVEFRAAAMLSRPTSPPPRSSRFTCSASGNATLRPVLTRATAPRRAHRVARVQHGPGVAGRRSRSLHQRSWRRSDALSAGRRTAGLS